MPFTDESDWIMTRASCRMFRGKEGRTNALWLKTSEDSVMNSFVGAQKIK